MRSYVIYGVVERDGVSGEKLGIIIAIIYRMSAMRIIIVHVFTARLKRQLTILSLIARW